MENKLWYKAEATCFEEALPLGNGSFGAMVYGGTKKEKLSLNLDTLWSGKKRTYISENAFELFKKAQELVLLGKNSEAEEVLIRKFYNMWPAYYLPMADLIIERDIKTFDCYYRDLDLEKAITKTTFNTTENECFISYPDKVLIFSENSSTPQNIEISLMSLLKYEISFKENTLILSGRCPYKGGSTLDAAFEVPYIYDENEGISFTTALKVLTDGSVSFENSKLKITSAKNFTIFTAAESSFKDLYSPYAKDHENECLNILNNALSKGAIKIKEDHINDFESQYKLTSLNLHSSNIDLPTDERLKNPNKENDLGLVELLFSYGKYLTLSSSRKGTQASNLQGIWNDKLYAPWWSCYAVNINTQMNYWPTLRFNLDECYEPLISLIKNISETGKETAKNYYNAEGFCAHCSTDIWGHTSPTGGHWDYAHLYAFWPLASGWLCTHLFEYFEYTLDKEFLKNTAYPIMKEACKFYLSLLTFIDGEYLLTPTVSPENRFIDDNNKDTAVCKKTAMTQAIIKELFTDTVKSAEILNIDPDFRSDLQEKIDNIHPHVIGSDGRILEWDKEYKEFEVDHRHVSHLFGLFPGNQITTESTPNLAEAAKKSLNTRGDGGTGWSLGWKINLWAKLKEGERALKLIFNQLKFIESSEKEIGLKGGSYTNLLDAHPPFQIDGNFGATAGITQMFLQYECGKIKILPALPSIFKSGEIKGIKTKGNVKVDLKWDEKGAEATFVSPVSQDILVEIGGKVLPLSLKANEIRKIF